MGSSMYKILLKFLFNLSLFSLICVFFVIANNDDLDQEGDPPGFNKMTFETPTLSEEEQHSQHMPNALRCDSCRVIAFEITKAFRKNMRKYNSKKGLMPESEIIDTIDDVCAIKTFENIGVKEVKKQLRLNAEPIDVTNKPGVIAGGGKWPGRIIEMCTAFAGEVGEQEMFDAFYQNQGDWTLEKFLCYQQEIGRNYCLLKNYDHRKDEL